MKVLSNKAERSDVPAHLKVILEAADKIENLSDRNLVRKAVLGSDTLPVGIDRNITKAEFNDLNQLVITFDTGEKLTTKSVQLEAVESRVIAVGGGGYPSIPYVQGIQFDTQVIPPDDTEGFMKWNPLERTLDIHMGDGVTQQVGQEFIVNCANYTGVSILNGRVVSFSGTDTEHDLPKIEPIVANGSMSPLYVIGVTTEQINDSGNHGRVTALGKVRDIDTTGAPYGETWNEGDFLFVHPSIPGGLTNVEPGPPNVSIFVGLVLSKDVNLGSILVKPSLKPRLSYGVFSSLVDQSAALVSTPYAITLSNTEIASGISIVDSSKISIQRSGLYRLSFSIQLAKPSPGDDSIWIWLRRNGVDVPNSATRLLIEGNNGYEVAAWDFTQNVNGGDYLQLMYAVNDTAITLDYAAATGFAPATPSVIINVTQVNQ